MSLFSTSSISMLYTCQGQRLKRTWSVSMYICKGRYIILRAFTTLLPVHRYYSNVSQSLCFHALSDWWSSLKNIWVRAMSAMLKTRHTIITLLKKLTVCVHNRYIGTRSVRRSVRVRDCWLFFFTRKKKRCYEKKNIHTKRTSLKPYREKNRPSFDLYSTSIQTWSRVFFSFSARACFVIFSRASRWRFRRRRKITYSEHTPYCVWRSVHEIEFFSI